MNKTLLIAASVMLMLASCGGQKKCTCNCKCGCSNCTCSQCNTAKDASAVPEYKILTNAQVDLNKYPTDKDGYITLFDGKSLQGWRGYCMQAPPKSWNVQDGAIHLKGSGTGEAQVEGGGDLIFSHKFKNFTLELEYKISKGGNSGIFYLAQEVTTKNNGKDENVPIWQSCSEYQVLDNANHPDAQLGVDGDRQAASLYDMVPAKPQNAKPFGQWNKVKIVVYEGTVVHYQNDTHVLEYHLWTPKWNEMLQNSKFKQGGDFPIAYELLKNIGGGQKGDGGYIGLQDHGDDVWYRSVRVKIMK